LRDIKLTPYTDATNTALGVPVDLPVSRTLTFSETEEFSTLEGDDETAATHGAGAIVEWELESGGISLQAWAVLSGATYNGGASRRSIKKNVAQQRGSFKIEGQIISDSGGDVHCEIFRAKCNASLDGEFSYGNFMLTNCSGVGYGSQMAVATGDPDTAVVLGDLYRFTQNGSVTTINAGTPAPIGLSSGAVAATTVALTWVAPTPTPDTYTVYHRVWTAGNTNPWIQSTTTPTNGTNTTTAATVTGLVTATHYEFVVRATDNAIQSANSNIDDATTA
jgi:hypothetical protein